MTSPICRTSSAPSSTSGPSPKNKAAIDRAREDETCTIVAGGSYDDSVGYFVRPTVVECTDPENEVFRTEYFGPFLAVHVYDDSVDGAYDAMLTQMESVSDYALTGSVISNDRAAAAYTMEKLRYAAGNFYINDKSTGAVVGQQPFFGGGRASGTNDKAGAPQNLMRWDADPRHQGDAGPADRLHLPAHGLTPARRMPRRARSTDLAGPGAFSQAGTV
ncbi:1-pyrroline-5-carboxylate dehydrogenase [Streptomyces violaceorubidus]